MQKELINQADEQQMFHIQHSRAFVAFASLEQQLAGLLTLWADEKTAEALFNAFYGIESFRSKLEFVDRFMLNHLSGNEPGKASWKAALAACQKSADGRNKLAHWHLHGYADEKPGRRFVLIPPSINPSDKLTLDGNHLAQGKAPGYALTIYGIATMAMQMTDAFVLLLNARYAAFGLPIPFPGMQIPSGVPTFEVLVAQYRGMDMMLQTIREQPKKKKK